MSINHDRISRRFTSKQPMSTVRIGARMRPLIAAIALCAALCAPAAASAAQSPPDSLYTAAPAEHAATANPTDGGRSTLLLALAAAALVAAAGLTVFAF